VKKLKETLAEWAA